MPGMTPFLTPDARTQHIDVITCIGRFIVAKAYGLYFDRSGHASGDQAR